MELIKRRHGHQSLWMDEAANKPFYSTELAEMMHHHHHTMRIAILVPHFNICNAIRFIQE